MRLVMAELWLFTSAEYASNGVEAPAASWAMRCFVLENPHSVRQARRSCIALCFLGYRTELLRFYCRSGVNAVANLICHEPMRECASVDDVDLVNQLRVRDTCFKRSGPQHRVWRIQIRPT